jgi:AcrR family transcriptional regulator
VPSKSLAVRPRRSKSPLRRVPTQERSKKRLETILDAAADEFAAVGFEAGTMDAVAARAETSIGSVYTFFPNKLALFEALAERTLRRSDATFERIVTSAPPDRHWTDILDDAIGAFAAFQADPTFRAIWMNMQLYGVYAKADAGLHKSFVARTEALVARHARDVPPAKRRLIAAMVVHAVSALLYVAARSKPEEGRAMVEETRLMLRRYLEVYAGTGRSRAAG